MHDFDAIIDRRHTGSLKFDRYATRDVLPMWVADMDFRSPQPVIDALKARAEHGVFGYSEASESQTAAVVDMLAAKYQWPIDPDWLVWSPGVVPMLNVAGRMLQPHQRILITTPIYPPFLTMPKVADRPHDAVPMVWDSAAGHWTFDFDALEAAITPDTGLFMLCSPYNPLGRVFDEAELRAIAALCLRHDLILVSDEIHCELILDAQRRHLPTATLGADIALRTIAMYAPSKTFNLPGLGCAFAVIPEPRLRARFKTAARGNISEVTAMGYAGCEAAYRYGEPWRLDLLAYLRANRDLVQQTIASLPGVSTTHVQATYLQWINVEALALADPWEHVMAHGLCLSPSRPFGVDGYLRLNFGCPRATLQRGLDLFTAAIQAL